MVEQGEPRPTVSDWSVPFAQVVALIRDTPLTPEIDTVTIEEKLKLYGLYKRVREGPCTEDAPSMLRPEAYAKHHAWKGYSDLSEERAMEVYVRIAASQKNWLGQKCMKLLEVYDEKRLSNQDPSLTSNDDSGPPSFSEPAALPVQSSDLSSRLGSFMGVKPLIPRGQIDISFSDLAWAARQAFFGWESIHTHRQLEGLIAGLWQSTTGRPCVVGISVRSLLDLFLAVKQFPKDSEIIMTPCINVPGMVHILQHHSINVVPIDFPPDEHYLIRVDCEAVKQAITPKTVAILVVHPFGIISASLDDMAQLRALADDHKITLVEDCAECYTGLRGKGCYSGSPHAHISYFSFGLIKTATALGGGVAIVRDEELVTTMNRVQMTQSRQQSRWEFLSKVIKAFLLLAIARSPVLYGAIVLLLRRIGANPDAIVTRLLRSLSSYESNERPGRCIQLVRRRPCNAMLSLLLRRLKGSEGFASSRQRQCLELTKLLSGCAPESIRHFDTCIQSSFWLFPALVEEPDVVCRHLMTAGFDSTKGASQLKSVAGPDICPRAFAFMNKIVYLPVCGQTLGKRNLVRLATTLSAETDDFAKADRSPPTASSKTLALVVLFVVLASVVPVSTLVGFLFLSCKIVIGYYCCLYAFGALLLRNSSSYYLERSKSFSKHCSMYNKAGGERGNRGQGPVSISSIAGLELPVCDAEEKRTVLVTGCTGFIGSLVLRDLLLHRQALCIHKIILVCRRKKGLSPQIRVDKLLQSDLFSFLSVEEKRDLVMVLEGDVTKSNAGLGDRDLSSVLDDQTLTHVFHCAASVSFTQSLADSAQSNISSALNLQSLTGSLRTKAAHFIHVSTAFVHGSLTGSESTPLSEDLFPLGDFDPMRLYTSMLGTQYYASRAMRELGFQNSYTFSKCVCEHLLSKESSVKTVIIRPSIVGPALENPFEGWAGEKPSTLVAAACLYLVYQWNLWSFGEQRVPCVPVDVVSRFIVSKAFEEGKLGVFESESASESSSEDGFEKVRNLGSSAAPESDIQCYIHNAAWDVSSPEWSGFSWLEYAMVLAQLGSVLGCFGRATVYVGLIVTTRLLPKLHLTADGFQTLHNLVVKGPFSAFSKAVSAVGGDTSALEKVEPFLDLPYLFYPFMSRPFWFRSKLVPPAEMTGDRYCFSCSSAAAGFFMPSRPGVTGSRQRDLRFLRVGGRWHDDATSDAWWSLTQPRGDVFLRLGGCILRKLFRATCNEVTLDVVSFEKVRDRAHQGARIVLCPTHRSFYDFLVVTYALFAIPELQIDLPFIAAADDFERIPLLGYMAKKMRAFFVYRGRSKSHPLTGATTEAIADSVRGREVVEIFVEGTRSRDRRFVRPKTGLLRCLSEQGSMVVVPVTVSYEFIPDQAGLVSEACGGTHRAMSLGSLSRWVLEVIKGNVQLGRIHVVAADPLAVSHNEPSVRSLGAAIQERQSTELLVSEYHVKAASRLLQLDQSIIYEALCVMDCRFWPKPQFETELELPNDLSEIAAITFQASPSLGSLLSKTRPKWSRWLCELSLRVPSPEFETNRSVRTVAEAFVRMFDAADEITERAIALLKSRGFQSLEPHHVLQACEAIDSSVPRVVLWASIGMQVKTAVTTCHGDAAASAAGGVEEYGFWGYPDSRFVSEVDGRGKPYVIMKGDHYFLSGSRLANLIPFIEEATQRRVNLEHENFLDASMASVDETRISDVDAELVRSSVGVELSFSKDDRLRHAAGHALQDTYFHRCGNIRRVPDAVIRPTDEAQVESLVQVASRQNWCLIPFGGGTNVSQSTACPSIEVEPRPILSVDMKLMNRLLWVDEQNGLAGALAGITGQELAKELKRIGYTMGHEPDSLEFSTLGGWIATKASGMKRTKYGNIEDIVKGVRVASGAGILGHGESGQPWGRESCGLDLSSLVIGSEGCLGIITSAVIRIWPLPEVTDYDAILFPDFESGFSFARQVSRLGQFAPASLRVLDNEHFRLGQALTPEPGSMTEACVQALGKALLERSAHIDRHKVVCATLTFEGTKDEVQAQRRRLDGIKKRCGGISLGTKAGKSGYEMTFLIAYLRDFALTYSYYGESFETFAPWSKVLDIVNATKARIRHEYSKRYLPGKPFVGCRITQLYHEGACLYFYLCANLENVTSPNDVFAQLEHAAREEILAHGGSLSHHHGIGKLRSSFLPNVRSPALLQTLRRIKEAIDPDNIFGARNGAFACDASHDSDDNPSGT